MKVLEFIVHDLNKSASEQKLSTLPPHTFIIRKSHHDQHLNHSSEKKIAFIYSVVVPNEENNGTKVNHYAITHGDIKEEKASSINEYITKTIFRYRHLQRSALPLLTEDCISSLEEKNDAKLDLNCPLNLKKITTTLKVLCENSIFKDNKNFPNDLLKARLPDELLQPIIARRNANQTYFEKAQNFCVTAYQHFRKSFR